MFHTFIAAAYALISATIGVELVQIFNWDAPQAVLAAAVSFAFFVQLHMLTARGAERRRIAREIVRLETDNGAIRQELEETRSKMAEVGAAFARRGDAQEKKVIGELQIIEGLIREFTASIATKSAEFLLEEHESERGGAGIESAVADPQLLQIIRRSLEENRVDLYLQPTVSLPQRKLRFYEALSRLRSDDGSIIMPAQYIKVAAPAGLMSVVDNLLLFRCVQIMRRLTQKRRDIGVFCNISAFTLTDAEFFPQFLDYLHHNRDLSGQIVFEFTQQTLNASDAAEESSLRYLSGLGFQLSMDQVTSLDLDFAKLKTLGFRYIKVKPDVLFSIVRPGGTSYTAEEFKDLLARNGVNLIVERIEDEKTVADLAEFGVDYGQGYLFGEPKHIAEMTEAHDAKAPLASVSNVTFLSQNLARRLAG
jgi:cyclic-di-GMP phosphodiesterase TipF (flagellum assembly factor)